MSGRQDWTSFRVQRSRRFGTTVRFGGIGEAGDLVERQVDWSSSRGRKISEAVLTVLKNFRDRPIRCFDTPDGAAKFAGPSFWSISRAVRRCGKICRTVIPARFIGLLTVLENFQDRQLCSNSCVSTVPPIRRHLTFRQFWCKPPHRKNLKPDARYGSVLTKVRRASQNREALAQISQSVLKLTSGWFWLLPNSPESLAE